MEEEDSFGLSHTSLSLRELLDSIQQSEQVMTNKIASLAYTKFLNRDICLKPENDKYTATSLARLNDKVYVTAVSGSDKDSADQVDKKRCIQKNYQKAPSKHPSFAVQPFLQTLSTALLRVNKAELFNIIRVVSLYDENLKVWLRESTNVVYTPDTNLYYVVVTVKWITEHILRSICSVFECYFGWISFVNNV